jgi:hypothetical protein
VELPEVYIGPWVGPIVAQREEIGRCPDLNLGSDGSDRPTRHSWTRLMSTPSMSARSSCLRSGRLPSDGAAQVGGVRDGEDPGPSSVPSRGHPRTGPRQRAEVVCDPATYGAVVPIRVGELPENGPAEPPHTEAKTSWHTWSDLDKGEHQERDQPLGADFRLMPRILALTPPTDALGARVTRSGRRGNPA